MERLDKFLVIKGYFPSREKAQLAIKDGQVFVNGKICDSSHIMKEGEVLEVKKTFSYVSRGAFKLLGAIDKFGLNFNGKVVLDIGSSTGGFTQVALENGASKVYALDVGSDQLDEILKKDERVVNMEKTDFRTAPKLDVDFVVSDLSFISLRYIVPKLVEEYQGIEMMLLFKPQFECGPVEARRHNGVVRDRALHQKLLQDFVKYLEFFKIKVSGLAYSPVTGKNGNIEYLFHLNGKREGRIDAKKVVDQAFKAL